LEYFARAQALYEKHSQIYVSLKSELAMMIAMVIGKRVLNGRNRNLDEGIRQLHGALESEEREYGKNDPRVLSTLSTLANLLVASNKTAECRELVDRGFSIVSATGNADLHDRSQLYDLRSKLEWTAGNREGAVTDLRQALDLIHARIGQAVGSEMDRAQYGSMDGLMQPFERMVDWASQTGHVAEGFAAADQYRSRTLLEQLLNRSGDMLAGISPDRRSDLVHRRTQAFAEVSKIETEINALTFATHLGAEEKRRRNDDLLRASVPRKSRSIPPTFRTRLLRASDARSKQAGALPEIQAWCAKNAALAGIPDRPERSYLIVVRHKQNPHFEAAAECGVGWAFGPARCIRVQREMTDDLLREC
jgi:hypothetical protein